MSNKDRHGTAGGAVTSNTYVRKYNFDFESGNFEKSTLFHKFAMNNSFNGQEEIVTQSEHGVLPMTPMPDAALKSADNPAKKMHEYIYIPIPLIHVMESNYHILRTILSYPLNSGTVHL